MKRIVLALALVTAAAGTSRAGSYGTELPFVLGTSARVSALGVTGVSLVGDASIQYYNPAVLNELQWKEFSFYRSGLYESGAAYHAVSYAQPMLSNGTVAVSFMRLDVGGVEERDVTNQLLSSDLHDAQTRVLVGFGRSIASNISAGFNLVFDNHSFGDYSGSGFGLDVGLSAAQSVRSVPWLRAVRQGFVIRNVIEPTLKLDRERVADPTQFAFGMSVLTDVRGVAIATSIDIVNPKFSPVSVHVGQEMTYMNNYSLRFGVDESTPTFGLGARYRSVALDYAYRSENLGDDHRISLAVRFGPSRAERHTADRAARESEMNTRIGDRMADMERQQVQRSLGTGKALLADGKYAEALSHFEAALLWDPDNEEANVLSTRCRYNDALGHGRDLMDTGNYVGALVHLREAQRIMPGQAETDKLIAECNSRIEQTQTVTATVNKLLKTAIDLYADRRFSEAVGGFDEILSIAPGNALATEYRAKCLANIRSAVTRHKQAATRYAAQEDYEHAIQELRAVLRYHKDPAVVRDIERYTALFKQASVEQTPPPVDEKPDETPDNTTVPPVNMERLEPRYASGLKHFDDGDFEMAIKDLSFVWTAEPTFHNVSSLLSRAYMFVGMNHYAEQNYADAISMWERALTVDPENRKAERYIRMASEEARKLGGMDIDG